jgi:Cft2 family RNA processing exonuclease
MAIAATRTYERNIELFNKLDRDKLAGEGLSNGLPALRYSESTEESMAINRIGGGAVIIAGSGMCTGGRIRHHLKYNLWRCDAHVVFCGFRQIHPPCDCDPLVENRKLSVIAQISFRFSMKRQHAHEAAGFSAGPLQFRKQNESRGEAA